MQIGAEAAPGLQGECAQAQGVGGAQALLRIGQCIKDACVGQGLAAAGGGHVDDEGAVRARCLAHCGGCVECLVLPGETWIGATFAQAAVVGQSGQVALEAGQGMRDQPGIAGDAEQVLVQRLLEAIAVGIGVERRLAIALHAQRRAPGQAGVVMVGQHQHQPRKMQDVRIVQPDIGATQAQCKQALGQSRGLCAPLRFHDRQGSGRRPVRQDAIGFGGLGDFIPVVRHHRQRLFQPGWVEVQRPLA